MWRAKGQPKKIQGTKFALVELFSHDLKFAPDRFFKSIWRGTWGTVKLSLGFTLNKLKRYSLGRVGSTKAQQA